MTQQPHDFDCVCLNCQSGGVAVEEALGEDVSSGGEYGICGTCESCGRPRQKHVIIREEQLEEVWKQGILATICAHVNCDEVAVWVTRDVEEIDGCDEEFMRSISS